MDINLRNEGNEMKHVRRLILAALILLLVCALPEAYASIEEYAVEATLGQSVTASPLDWWSNPAYFRFTAPEDGLYMLSLTKDAQGEHLLSRPMR